MVSEKVCASYFNGMIVGVKVAEEVRWKDKNLCVCVCVYVCALSRSVMSDSL